MFPYLRVRVKLSLYLVCFRYKLTIDYFYDFVIVPHLTFGNFRRDRLTLNFSTFPMIGELFCCSSPDKIKNVIIVSFTSLNFLRL